MKTVKEMIGIIFIAGAMIYSIKNNIDHNVIITGIIGIAGLAGYSIVKIHKHNNKRGL